MGEMRGGNIYRIYIVTSEGGGSPSSARDAMRARIATRALTTHRSSQVVSGRNA